MENLGCRDGYLYATYGTCPTWLIENLTYYDVSNYSGSNNTDKYSFNKNNNYGQDILGYWILSSTYDNPNCGGAIINQGKLGGYEAINSVRYGIRPVIAVSLSDLSA